MEYLYLAIIVYLVGVWIIQALIPDPWGIDYVLVILWPILLTVVLISIVFFFPQMVLTRIRRKNNDRQGHRRAGCQSQAR